MDEQPVQIHEQTQDLSQEQRMRSRPGWFRRRLEHLGLVAPRGGPDIYEHRRGEPRGFVAIWTAYLLGSSLITFVWMGAPWRVGVEGYSNSSRSLLVCLMVGISVLWPMIRLSQKPARAGGIGVGAIDAMIVWISAQALIWPQSLVAGWPLTVMLALAGVSLGWTLIVGSAIAWALGPGSPGAWKRGLGESASPLRRSQRGLAMLFLCVVTLLGPALSGLGTLGTWSPTSEAWLWLSSPVGAAWTITRDESWTGIRALVSPESWRGVGLSLLLGSGGWALLLAGRRPVPDRG